MQTSEKTTSKGVFPLLWSLLDYQTINLTSVLLEEREGRSRWLLQEDGKLSQFLSGIRKRMSAASMAGGLFRSSGRVIPLYHHF